MIELRYHRVLASLGMMSVLLLTFTASTSVVSNGYQKVYGAADFPTPDLATKIRESINNQIREELFPPSSSADPRQAVEITLSGFPHQTGESVTKYVLDCHSFSLGTGCRGSSNIVIPGIGEGSVYVDVVNFSVFPVEHQSLEAIVEIYGLPGQTAFKSIDFTGKPFTAEFNCSLSLICRFRPQLIV